MARVCAPAALLLPILATAQGAMAQEAMPQQTAAPAGAEISIRLSSGVSTWMSKPSDPVAAVVIAPVKANGRTVIPAGAVLSGVVEKVAQSSAASQRAALVLRFRSLTTGGVTEAISARVESVDNAREEVDEQGQINGVLPTETVGGRLDAELGKLGEEYGGFADILSAAKAAVFRQPSTEIDYPAGVEMTLRLAEPFALPPGMAPAPTAAARPIAGLSVLARLVSREPFRTAARNPPGPSDITNLLLVATENTLRRAFREAGWSGAAGLNSRAKFETLRAVVEDRGYSEAPVSVLLLEGKPPDLVFEKTNNTFAKRHHLRIWRRPGKFRGKPIWAVAATHDIGIDFSETERTFVHRIDPRIDGERDKVLNDLLFAGRVEDCGLLERPAVPGHARNATGDDLETDGRIAVAFLR